MGADENVAEDMVVEEMGGMEEIAAQQQQQQQQAGMGADKHRRDAGKFTGPSA